MKVKNLVVDRRVSNPINNFEIVAEFYDGDLDATHHKIYLTSDKNKAIEVINLLERIMNQPWAEAIREPPFNVVPEGWTKEEIVLANHLSGITMYNKTEWLLGEEKELIVQKLDEYPDNEEGFWPFDNISLEFGDIRRTGLWSYRVFYYDSRGDKHHVEKEWEE